MNEETHIGRSFSGHRLEDACPCPQEPCGLVSSVRTKSKCPEHGLLGYKTIRQTHLARNCPGAAA